MNHVFEMSQPGFFDLSERYAQLSAAGDPLVKLDELIPWNKFRSTLNRAFKKVRKSNAGRPPYDYVLMFKMLVLQSLYNISDHQVEFQVRDRLSFMRFLGISLEDNVPDEKTLWAFREQLVQSKAIDKLFAKFDRYLSDIGYKAECGSIVDASIVEVPRQRNSRDSNKKIKEGEIPEHWEDNPNKLRQKDVDARWTKKRGETYYGYKDHISIDAKHKLIRSFEVTNAAMHDSHIFGVLLKGKNAGNHVWADSAYWTDKNVLFLESKGYLSRLSKKASKGRWLPNDWKRINRRLSKIRKRVEHVFGFIENSLNGKYLRTIGLKRARWKIGMMNLVYNMCRCEQLERLGVA